MQKIQLISILVLITTGFNYGQTYYAGFKSVRLKDSTRVYKPDTSPTDSLHFRPVDLDIWYPSNKISGQALRFEDLFGLFEQRAIDYQDNEDYSGITAELAQFYVAEFGLGTRGEKLLNIRTNSYDNLEPAGAKHPVILYMAGYNGMGFENYRVLEELARNGFVVVSIWSVGRSPGDMTNEKADMLEQVYDAEFAMRHLKDENEFNADLNTIGVLGCSWGGMSAAVLIDRNPDIKTFVSLDGTETHYFGEEDENDRYIEEIYDSALPVPDTQTIDYLYLESGDKLDEFDPTKEFNYFLALNSKKYYLRFTNSQHADFTCIPSILEASENSVQVYSHIQELTLTFFKESLTDIKGFQTVWENTSAADYTSQELYDISGKQRTIAELSGAVVDRASGQPLPYVNIGLLNEEIGTVTDSSGKFHLNLNEEFANDTIRVSSIGYGQLDIPVKEIQPNRRPMTIELEEKISELDEVVLTAKGFKNKTLGNKTESKFLSTGFGYDQLGAEIGIKINIRKNPTFVDALNFNITQNRLSARSVFRVNFYTVENNKPNDNILNENILVRIEPKQVGKITVDLKPYDIILTADTIVTLEWVESQGENNKGEAIFFSLGLLNSGTLYKRSSHSKFKKHSSLGVGFNVDVRYYK